MAEPGEACVAEAVSSGRELVRDIVSNGATLVDGPEMLKALSVRTGGACAAQPSPEARDNEKFAVWLDRPVETRSHKLWGNWSLLNASWEAMRVLTGKIWASPAKARLHLFRAKPPPEGVVFLADCAQSRGRDLLANWFLSMFEKQFTDGAVLCGAIRTAKGSRFFLVVVANGHYRIVFRPPTFVDEDEEGTAASNCRHGQSVNPVELIGEVIEGDGVRFLTPTPEDGARFEDLFGTRLVRDMRAGITALGDAWWGLYLPSDEPDKLPELKQNSGIVLCYMNDLSPGYLFSVVTEKETHGVAFCSSPCGCHYSIRLGIEDAESTGVRISFKSVLELFAYLKEEGRIEFLPTPASVVTCTK